MVWCIFIITTVLNTLYAIAFYAGYNISIGSPFDYNNPLVVISSLSLVVAFSKLNLKSDTVNWIAASSFAIYLFHTHSLIFDSYYLNYFHEVYNSYDGLRCFGMTIAFLFCIAALAIIIDQPRIWIWKQLTRPLTKKTANAVDR